MNIKKCPKCKKVKNKTEFYKDKNRKDGLRVYCKLCSKKVSNEYKNDNSDKIIKYRIENSDKMKEYLKIYYESNKEEIKQKAKEYYYENRELKLEYVKKYRLENRDKINEYRRSECKDKPHIYAWRIVLKNTIRRMNTTKEDNTINLLGYSALELKKHISSLFTDGMSWDNYGEWHIDHIKPVISFNKNTPVSIVCELSNLQPLWSTTREINDIIYEGNLNKGSKSH